MRIGVTIPHDDVMSSEDLKNFVSTAEELDFDFVVALEHILGADSRSRPGWDGYYDISNSFRDPLVLFGFAAALTSRIELATGILVLPMRQTALVARQAADLAALSGGRFCLGVGIGWNRVEYEALGIPFRDRTSRFEEQIAVLRQLLSNEVVSFSGTFHQIDRAGLNPLPPARVPIFIGGHADAALARAARIADGLVTYIEPDAEGRSKLDVVYRTLDEYGRDRSAFTIRGRIIIDDLTDSEIVDRAEKYAEMGVTELSLNTITDAGRSVAEHLEQIHRLAALLSPMQATINAG